MAWSLATFVLFLWSLWFVGGLIVRHFQGAGLNGVYVAEDGAGEMTFWPDGTYLMSAFGINLPGRYRIRNNGTVDMTAQYDSVSNANQQSHQADPFMGMIARGMDGEVSSDKNTFAWQGHTYSYDHRPTIVPPSVPDPSATNTTAPSVAAPPSQMHTPTPQEINQSLAKPGDEFHANTDVNPNVADPNQIYQRQVKQSEWGPNSPKMRQYYATHPNMEAGTGSTAPTDSGGAAPSSATAPPTGIIMPDENLEEELKKVK